jgi:hypothetical protein
MAIDLDKKYIKGYYRMATAKLALGKYKEALNYFRQVPFSPLLFAHFPLAKGKFEDETHTFFPL